MYNKLLQRQLQRFQVEESILERYAEMFRAISNSYEHSEKDHRMLERSIELSSGEMTKLYSELNEETGKLKTAQEEIRTMFENTESVFFSIDIRNVQVNQMSQACLKVYGYTPDVFMNNLNLWYEVIHPDDKYLLEKHTENLAKGMKLSYQYRIVHADKSIRWIESKIIPTLDEKGLLIRIDGIANDITEKKAAEKKILSGERLLSEALHLARMGNWNINLKTGELFYSDELKNIFGVDKNYIPDAAADLSFIHPEDRDSVLNEILRTRETEDTIELSYRIIRKNDEAIRVVDTSVRTARDKEGVAKRIYGITRDITERAEAEQKIERYNMLLYQISHDLRSPLNSAKNYIYLALKRVNDETAKSYLVKIHDAYNRMEHRILSLLDLQRLNRAEAHIEPVNIRLLVKDILASIDGLKGFNEVKISTDINLPADFICDRQFLHSIIHNLISNAITHRRSIPDARITIAANYERDNLVIKVSDNGSGIKEEMKPKIFEKFVKGDTSANGTGLGLYIVKNLTAKLKGDVQFESTLMQGTTFTVTIPLTSQMAEQKQTL